MKKGIRETINDYKKKQKRDVLLQLGLLTLTIIGVGIHIAKTPKESNEG